jgi:hypothetical protein
MQYTNDKGRVFTLIGSVPYTTRAKKKVTLNVWQAHCAHPGCTNLFTVKVPDTDIDFTNSSFRMANCELHKLTKDEAIRRMADATSKVTDAQVLEIRALLKEGHSPATLALIYPLSDRTIRAIRGGIYRA